MNIDSFYPELTTSLDTLPLRSLPYAHLYIVVLNCRLYVRNNRFGDYEIITEGWLPFGSTKILISQYTPHHRNVVFASSNFADILKRFYTLMKELLVLSADGIMHEVNNCYKQEKLPF